jgi:hypothetical protein
MAKQKPVREGLDGTDRPVAAVGPGLAGLEDPPPKKNHGRPSKVRANIAKPPKKPRVKAPPPEEPPADRVLGLQPEAVLGADDSQKDIIDNLFSKAFDRWVKRDEANRGVDAIAKVVSFIQSGRSLKEMDAELVPILSEQASKSSILQAVMFNHQMERVVLYWDARWRLERDLWEDLRGQKLTPREKLALLALASKEAKESADYINRANGAFTPMTEVEPTIERAGKHSATKALAAKKQEFEGTTPQGREIIRRLTFKAKQAAAKIVDKELDNGNKPDGGTK